MAACEPVSFSGITPEVFTNLKNELTKNGFTLEGSSGVVNGPMGITIQYGWDEATSTLHIEVLEKSFFVPCNMIYDQISNTVNKFIA